VKVLTPPSESIPDQDVLLALRELSARVRELATATLIARPVPPVGGRHDYALAVAGFVLRNGRINEQTALKLMSAARHAAGADSREATRDSKGIAAEQARDARSRAWAMTSNAGMRRKESSVL
jgi:hypothetical protein